MAKKSVGERLGGVAIRATCKMQCWWRETRGTGAHPGPLIVESLQLNFLFPPSEQSGTLASS
jgi:hypothetical protein